MNHINPGEVTDFTREFEYFNYLQNKVYCEAELTRVVYNRVVLSEASGEKARKLIAINEGKIIDKIKEIWSKFVEFINKIAAKFLEKMTNLLVKETDYLKKYKEIILQRKPKHIEISYHGKYMTAVDRLLKVKVASFPDKLDDIAIDKDKDGNATDDEITASIVNYIFKKYNSTDFDKFNSGENMADQFKSYFIGADKGDTNTHLDASDCISLKDMYNFCMNHKQAEDVVKKDQNMIQATANKIDSVWNQYKKDHPEVEKADNAATTGGNQTGNATPTSDKGGEQTGGEAKEEQSGSLIVKNSAFMNLRGLRYIREEEQNNNNNQNNNDQAKDNEEKAKDAEHAQENKDGNATKSNLQIRNTNIATKAGSVDKDNEDTLEKKAKDELEGKDSKAAVNFFNKYIDKWRQVCSNILTAKLTVYQQIAKDFMAIIRAHVQSYVGTNDKDANENKKAEDAGIDYNNLSSAINKGLNSKSVKNSNTKEEYIKNEINKIKEELGQENLEKYRKQFNSNMSKEAYAQAVSAFTQKTDEIIKSGYAKDTNEAIEILQAIADGLGYDIHLYGV